MKCKHQRWQTTLPIWCSAEQHKIKIKHTCGCAYWDAQSCASDKAWEALSVNCKFDIISSSPYSLRVF